MNLIGEHVDYSGGTVLPVAINRWTAAAFGPGTGRWRVASLEADTPAEFDASAPLVPEEVRATLPAWATYVAGAVEHAARIIAHRVGGRPGPMDVTIASDVPLGAGLSSSASLEVAVACGVAAASRLKVSAHELARIARRAEREFAGAPCGIMDQLASAGGRAGHALRIDCRDEAVTPVPLPASAAIVVIDSGVRHEVPGGFYAALVEASERAARRLGVECLCDADARAAREHAGSLSDAERAAALHATSEQARTIEFIEAMAQGDLSIAGRLLFSSHGSLRDTLGVSCVEVDRIVERARTIPGVFGARMTGAGFGGCVVVLCDSARADDIARSLAPQAPGARISARVEAVAGCAAAWST